MVSGSGLIFMIAVCLVGAFATFATLIGRKGRPRAKGLTPQRIALLIIYIVMVISVVRFVSSYIKAVEAEVGAFLPMI